MLCSLPPSPIFLSFSLLLSLQPSTYCHLSAHLLAVFPTYKHPQVALQHPTSGHWYFCPLFSLKHEKSALAVPGLGTPQGTMGNKKQESLSSSPP